MVGIREKRNFKKLRVSLVENCNFACTYCVADDEIFKVNSGTQTPPETFVERILKIHEAVNLDSVRLTGGEPTLYKNLPFLISSLKDSGIAKVTMTTNGSRLLRLGKSLKIAGLNDMNVSLDAVEFDIFKRINRSLKLREVLEGIDLCISLGINIKINCTIQNTINDSQILPVLEWGKERGLSVRFLELMKMGHIQNSHDTFYLPGNEIIKRISKKYKLIELGREKSSTSKYWQIENSIRVGIISNHSDPFCSDCDRLRMDHKGYIFGCLSSPVSFPIDGKIPLEEVLERAMSLKRKKDFTGSTLSMKKIGG